MQMKDGQDGINEINITPFVDVVLVLLIIFMISTPALVYRGLRVQLPKAVNGEDISHVTLSILVDASGRYFLDRRLVSLADLKSIVEKLKPTDTMTDAVISADASASHGTVMALADILKGLGIKNIGFATR